MSEQLTPLQMLRKTAEYLVSLGDNRETKYGYFDMDSWWEEDSVCGASGCIVGHMIKMFPECGIEIKLIYTEGGYEALQNFLSLSEEDSDFLFLPPETEVNTPEEAGRRVLDFLDERGL